MFDITFLTNTLFLESVGVAVVGVKAPNSMLE